ncbi:adenomatous polyposis coli protein isoform X2 [Folsomia candida]|nr:adenomatous polyposis coli protein isoform X2 [Folsomia candida]
MKEDCINLRRHTGMALTNLTVYDKTNKALLCGMKDFLMCLVNQLECDNEDICKISASVLRNLSCRVDSASMAALSEVSPCSKLMLAAMKCQKETTLKANLGAVWNLSAQSSKNMADISMAADDALPFLISLMKLNNPMMKEMKNPMTIIEHSSGILRNISGHLRASPSLKKILRENHCYEILLDHLKSSSMLVVGNACGTLCSLSGGPECEEDQRKLLDLNAIPMLKSLVYSKDQRISQGSSTALRNLLSSKFAKEYTPNLDSRLSAQIYTTTNTTTSSGHHSAPPGSDRSGSYMNIQQAHKSQSSDSNQNENDHGNGNSSSGKNNVFNNQQQPHTRIIQPEPPLAHQQSTSSAASLFQPRTSSANSGSRIQNPVVQFHNHPPLSLPLGGGYRNRPSTINYNDTEPLDLTITSAKSSPIHIISAAEFADMGNHHHQQQQHKLGRGNPADGGQTNKFHLSNRSQSQQGQPFHRLYNTNPGGLVHHHNHQNHDRSTDMLDSSSISRWQNNYSNPNNFNRSCPEILFQIPNTHQISVHDPKPVDYSASGSASSSCRGGGGGEGGANSDSLNDSNGGGGDTTFNYSLRFAEDDGDEDHHHTGGNNKSDDTVKTYCYEGTPQTFSKSNSCQDLVQELEFERAEASSSSNPNDCHGGGFGKTAGSLANKLQPIDEVKPYYVENTPAAFSRASSLSSIHSSDEALHEENADFAESSEQQQQKQQNLKSPEKHVDSQQSLTIQIPPQPIPRKRSSLPHTPRVTFSAEETPLMFSRCSSVASLDSLDVGQGESGGVGGHRNDDDLSDYSRRESEVVSPSELPDSPRALVPPVRFLERNNGVRPEPKERSKTEHKNCDEDDVKVYSVSMVEKSGFNSCRSLSPLTVDGEELEIIRKDKLDAVGQGREIPLSTSEETPTGAVGGGEEEGNTGDKPVPVKRAAFPDDELKVFAMEGTPFYGVSTATSLSDLMADIEDTPTGGDIPTKSNRLQKPNQQQVAAGEIRSTEVQNAENAALAVVNAESQPHKKSVHNVNGEMGKVVEGNSKKLDESITTTTGEESIYSDAQLLEKCIRVGKAMGIPKSQSEFRISDNENLPTGQTGIKNPLQPKMSSSNNVGGKQKLTSKSQDFEFDDPDLAALIQIGRNRTKDKDKTSSKNKGSSKKTNGKTNMHNSSSSMAPPLPKSNPPHAQPAAIQGDNESKIVTTTMEKVVMNQHNNATGQTENLTPVVALSPEDNKNDVSLTSNHETRPKLDKLDSTERKSTEECFSSVSEESPLTNSNNNESESNGSNVTSNSDLGSHQVDAVQTPLDPNQVSTMSIGSEWNDETPTFSSPIPSMSISTAFKLAESINVESLPIDKNSKPPLPPKTRSSLGNIKQQMNMNDSMNLSCYSVASSVQNDLLDNVEPPSIFSNLVSSTDCVAGNLQINPKSQTSSNLSDKLNKKWKALVDGGNTSSISNLTGQKPPPDFDMENSMISVASIKSEIYELSSSNDVFESAVEDQARQGGGGGGGGDNSIGANTYTIFPPENANRLSGVKSTDLSDGRNTVISEDFTDAEDIEEFETAPMEDLSEDGIVKPEKTDDEKEITTSNKIPIGTVSPSNAQTKPLMEVHPLVETNKYNTFVVKKSPMSSPRASPRQKRRDDPDRYRTHTINPVNMGKAFTQDANGNPDLKFATFRVGGPKVIKPQNMNNVALVDSDSSNSQTSTPGHSPKGIRGRRRPLYSSLPPSAIVRKQKTAPPPVPPKPARQASSSPARSTTSSITGTSSGVYVRPTRTTELRIAANNGSRDTSPMRKKGGETLSSRNSSNSSLNLIHGTSSRMSDCGGSIISSASERPKVAPKPPVRTTPSATSTFSSSGSNVPIHIKASNSSFGLGQQVKMTDSNLKGYSTLPKSSKFRSETPFSMDRYSTGGESKESIPGSEKSGKSSGIGKITNLWKKMDFRSHTNNKDAQQQQITTTGSGNVNSSSDTGKSNNKSILQNSEKDIKKSNPAKSKLQNFFGRGKKEKPQTSGIPKSTCQKQPFREPLPIHSDPVCNIVSADTAPASTSNIRVRRDGDINKVIVPPFNYTPPDRSTTSATNNVKKRTDNNDEPSSTAPLRTSKITTV